MRNWIVVITLVYSLALRLATHLRADLWFISWSYMVPKWNRFAFSLNPCVCVCVCVRVIERVRTNQAGPKQLKQLSEAREGARDESKNHEPSKRIDKSTRPATNSFRRPKSINEQNGPRRVELSTGHFEHSSACQVARKLSYARKKSSSSSEFHFGPSFRFRLRSKRTPCSLLALSCSLI